MDWDELVHDVPVEAKPDGLWTEILEYVTGPVTLKLATPRPPSRWFYAPGKWCFADGDAASLILPESCLFPDAPVGALIGKIGGSSAGHADGTMFLVGRTCVLEIKAELRGPLYATINDERSGMANNRGTISLSVSRLCKSPPPRSNCFRRPLRPLWL